jgi:translation initiation factor IF-2
MPPVRRPRPPPPAALRIRATAHGPRDGPRDGPEPAAPESRHPQATGHAAAGLGRAARRGVARASRGPGRAGRPVAPRARTASGPACPRPPAGPSRAPPPTRRPNRRMPRARGTRAGRAGTRAGRARSAPIRTPAPPAEGAARARGCARAVAGGARMQAYSEGASWPPCHRPSAPGRRASFLPCSQPTRAFRRGLRASAGRLPPSPTTGGPCCSGAPCS